MLIFSTSIFIDGDRKEEHLVDRCSNFPRRSLQTTVTARENTTPIDDMFFHVDRCSFFHVDQTTVTTRTNTSSIDDIFSASIFTDGDRKEEHHVDLRVDLYKQR